MAQSINLACFLLYIKHKINTHKEKRGLNMTKAGYLRRNARGAISLLVFAAVMLFAVHSYAISLSSPVVLGEDKGFVAPVGVTADGTNPATANVFVADYGASAILKIDKDKNVTSFISVQKPISIVFNSGKLYVITETDGIKTYLAADGAPSTPFGVGAGVVKKPSDIAVSGNIIYVTDAKDNNVKVYNMGNSGWETAVGGPIIPNTNGNGQFYMPASVEISNGMLLVSDYANVACTFRMTTQLVRCTNLEIAVKLNGCSTTNVWKTVPLTYDYYGTPKGKTQYFDTATKAVKRTYQSHGTDSTKGLVMYAGGLAVNSDNVYVADSVGKKIFIFDNISILTGSNYTTTAPLSGGNITPGWIPVADSVSSNFASNPMNPPSGYTRFKAVAGLGATYDNALVQLKDMVKIGTGNGSLLVVTDTFGRVFYFTENN